MHTPNILDTKAAIFVQLRVATKWVACKLLRVYYQDTRHQRFIWVDVEATDTTYTHGQTHFLHIAMENLHHRNYPGIVSISFQQEESDIAYKHQQKAMYAGHVDLELKQNYTSNDGYFWQGILAVCQYPTRGLMYIRDVAVSRFCFVYLAALSPLLLCVMENDKVQTTTKITVVMGEKCTPCVQVYGDIVTATVHIGGILYSGRVDKKRIEHVPRKLTQKAAGKRA